MSLWAERRRCVLRPVNICVLLAAVAVLLVVCSNIWLPLVGQFLVVSDPLAPTDAVVALAGGGPHRVAGAVELVESGYATWLIVTNMPLNTPGIKSSYADLMRTEAVWQGAPEDRILVAPGMVRTTYEEALAVRALAEERGFRSLTAVTDSFHTRRTSWAFQDAFEDSDIAVFVQPARQSWYQASAWWQDRDSLRETWTEYLKLALYQLGYR